MSSHHTAVGTMVSTHCLQRDSKIEDGTWKKQTRIQAHLLYYGRIDIYVRLS